MKILIWLAVVIALPIAAQHAEPQRLGWPTWEKLVDYPAFRMAIQELQCQMPGKLVIDSFRMTERSFDLKDTTEKLPKLLAGAGPVIQSLTLLRQEGVIPEGVFIMLEKPLGSDTTPITSMGDGAVSVNLLHPPSLAVLRAFFKTFKGSDQNILKAEQIDRAKLACEVIPVLRAHGGLTFSGKNIEEHMQMLSRLNALAAEGYHLKPPTQFVEITANNPRSSKPYYFNGNVNQLMVPANADRESLIQFFEK